MISISSFMWKLLQDSPKTFFVMFTAWTFPSLSSSLTNVAKFLMSTRSSSLEFNHVSLFLCFLNFFESYKTKYMMAYIIIVLDKISYNYYQEIVNENWKKNYTWMGWVVRLTIWAGHKTWYPRASPIVVIWLGICTRSGAFGS